MTLTPENHLFLRRCFDIARLGNSASTSPNPSVGAVIVAPNGRIIGEGFTQPYGGYHGEVMAVASVKTNDRSLLPFSTMYVSLEPCFHFGKTPPCVDLILREKIPNLVIAHLDPNPLVAGKSIAKLRENGVNIQIYNPNNTLIRQNTEGSFFSDNRQLENGKTSTLVPFFTNMTKKRPYIILKWAESADGFIGKSHQTVPISNTFSKRLVHKWRSEVDAIMVGTSTAALDNPELTNRFYYGKSPIRVVLDRNKRLSPSLKLFDGAVRTLVFSENEENTEGGKNELKIKNLESTNTTHNVQQLFVPFDDFLLENILIELTMQKVGILFIEGGEKLLSSFIKRGLWDEAHIITASKTLGEGIAAPKLLAASLQQTFQLDGDTVRFYVKS